MWLRTRGDEGQCCVKRCREESGVRLVVQLVGPTSQDGKGDAADFGLIADLFKTTGITQQVGPKYAT